MKEYKIVEVKKAQVEKTMNEMAKQGWEALPPGTIGGFPL